MGELIDKPADRQTVTNGLGPTCCRFVGQRVQRLLGQRLRAERRPGSDYGHQSRLVVAVGGGILVFLGLFPVLGALVALVPLPVLGGAGVALFGTVAASGIRTLSKVDFSGNANLVIVAFSFAAASSRSRCRTSTASSPSGSR